MSLSRTLAALLAVGSLTFVACGDGDDSDDGGGGSAAAGESSESTPSDEGEPEPGVVDVCAALTTEELGALLGGAVTVAEIPGGGCNFSQVNPQAPSAAVHQSLVDDFAGGFDALRAGVTSVVDGNVETLDDMGDDAFVAVGTAAGLQSIAGAGGLLLGEVMVQVTVLQGVELPADQVYDLTHDLLHLIADRA